MIKRALVSLSVMGLLAGCAGGPLAAPKVGTISGHVSTRACGGAARDDATTCRFHPAAGVTLSFRPVNGGGASVATTDSKGFYSISLPAGQYQVGPRDPIAAKQASRPLTVSAGQAHTADFSYTIQLL
ncbi:MAG: carboxypeptidase-like regulatory domain-containing protein [Candidatus Dormibacteraeota bacterium]|nr:carboxypeptidase-like regulatory domain-containing protein [Candidatus Dormibacteraeota bacterium]